MQQPEPARLTGLEERLTGLEHEFGSFRDRAAGEFADVRLELRRLRQDVVTRDDALRRDVAALSQRVERLERRLAEGQRVRAVAGRATSR